MFCNDVFADWSEEVPQLVSIVRTLVLPTSRVTLEWGVAASPGPTCGKREPLAWVVATDFVVGTARGKRVTLEWGVATGEAQAQHAASALPWRGTWLPASFPCLARGKRVTLDGAWLSA